MKVNFRPEIESGRQELAAKTAVPPTILSKTQGLALQELGQVRETLDSRYDDLKGGRVEPLDGEEAFARLRRKSQDHRPGRA